VNTFPDLEVAIPETRLVCSVPPSSRTASEGEVESVSYENTRPSAEPAMNVLEDVGEAAVIAFWGACKKNVVQRATHAGRNYILEGCELASQQSGGQRYSNHQTWRVIQGRCSHSRHRRLVDWALQYQLSKPAMTCGSQCPLYITSSVKESAVLWHAYIA